MSEHPRLGIGLDTRTKTFGTVNLALALRGRSSGWGKGGKPRRTFLGHVPRRPEHRGRYFVTLSVWRGAAHDILWMRSLGFHGTQNAGYERYLKEKV
jgi:hypothetical protein